MTIEELFRAILTETYTELSPETASFQYHFKDGILTILFEWSNGTTDWYNNLNFPATPYRGMRDRFFVHRGFLRVFKVIEKRLATPIHCPAVRSILIGGYSHGAAIAVLCQEYCVYHRPDIAEQIYGYGFGCPRVLWGIPANSVKNRFRHFYVIRNDKDIVTRLPPFIFGFHHVGTLLSIQSGKALSPIDAHRPENYIEALQRTERVGQREVLPKKTPSA